jgi:hypothetical protein
LDKLRKTNQPDVFTVNQPRRNNLAGRYGWMAQLRNRVLRVFRNSGIQTKAVLWIDMDCFGFWRSKKAISRLLKRRNWDTVATYGLQKVKASSHDIDTKVVTIKGKEWTYYDWLAYEDMNGCRVLWHSRGSRHYYPHGSIPKEVSLIDETIPAVNGTRVHSAFGPACFYRPNAIRDLWYNEQTRQCEHQEFHKTMRDNGRDRIFISKDIITLYDDP